MKSLDTAPLFEFSDRAELQHWLEENHDTSPFCWVATTRGKDNPNVNLQKQATSKA